MAKRMTTEGLLLLFQRGLQAYWPPPSHFMGLMASNGLTIFLDIWPWFCLDFGQLPRSTCSVCLLIISTNRYKYQISFTTKQSQINMAVYGIKRGVQWQHSQLFSPKRHWSKPDQTVFCEIQIVSWIKFWKTC